MTPKRTRRRFTAEFKAEVALAALTERQPLAELAARYQLTVAQISHWKLQLRQQAAQVFAPAAGIQRHRPLRTWSRCTPPLGSCRWKTSC